MTASASSNLAAALAAADELEGMLDFPGRYQDAGAYERGLAALIRQVEARCGRLDDGGPVCAIRLYGYRAVSTAGPASAVWNWIRQVRQKADA